MRLISAAISMDVDLEEARVCGDQLVLAGFAGINDVEAHLGAAEARRLAAVLCKGSVLWFLVKALVRPPPRG